MHQQHPSSVQVSKSCWRSFPLAISHHPAVTAVTSPPVSSRLENPMDSLHSPSWILHPVAKVVQLWPGPLTSEQGLLLSCVKGPYLLHNCTCSFWFCCLHANPLGSLQFQQATSMNQPAQSWCPKDQHACS